MQYLIRLATIFLFTGLFSFSAHATWFCEQAASEKNDNTIMACGIGQGESEELARKLALESAFAELDAICERSIDCKTFETLIEPQRNDCRKEKKGFKCVRAVLAIITKTKRKQPFQKDVSNKDVQQKLDVTVRIDPKDLIVINNGQVEEKKVCRHDISGLQKAMQDISTSARQDAMVAEAVKVPTDLLCFPVHAKIMAIFQRYAVDHDAYREFLRQTLDQLDDTSGDERAYIILDYWHRLGSIPEREWESAYQAVLRAQTHQLYRLMPRLISPEVANAKDKKREEARMDRLAAAALEKKLGRPMPLNVDEAMELFLRSFKSYRTRENPWAALYIARKYQDKLARLKPAKLHTSMASLYFDSESPDMKAAWNQLLAENVAKSAPSHDLSKKIADYMQDILRAIAKLDDEEDDDIKLIQMYGDHLKKFMAASGANLALNLQITTQDYERKARAQLCLDFKINCPELIPDTDRLQKMLGSKKADKRLEALALMHKMPAAAAKLEDELFQNLKDGNKGDIDHGNQIVKEAAEVLAIIPTKNKKIHAYMVDLIMNSRLHAQYIRAGMGPALEPLWVEQLKSGPQRHHMMIMLELNEYKKLQKATCDYMEALQKSSKEYYIKDAAKRAVLERC